MSKWLVNEWNKFKSDIHQKVDSAVEKWAQGQIQDAERFVKLEGELKAMKARMGKNKTGEPATSGKETN